MCLACYDLMRYLFAVVFSIAMGVSHAQTTSIAVVELFTSQGCSSCPAADRLLKEAVNAKNTTGEVYGLSFHVGYWNRLGWKDPYSSDQYTERQKWYAAKKRLGRIYTPQMIVDGQDEFVGSQKSKLVESLRSSFSSNEKSALIITEVKKNDTQVTVYYSGTGATSNEVLNVALVQKVASNRVPRGENRQKTLVHSNVVRAFRVVALRNKGQVALELPVLSASADYEVIAYAQESESLKVTAVGKAAF